MPRVHPLKLLRLARKVYITHHETGIRTLWRPTIEQYKIWANIFIFGWVFILKPRQIGATTAFLFEMAVWCGVMDAMGGSVNVETFIDTDKKADQLRDKAKDFLDQLGIKTECKQGKLSFEGGSTWHFSTAGGRRAAAGTSLHRVHLTELPFWRNPSAAYNSIMPSLSLAGWAVVDTTMGVDDPIGQDLWEKATIYQKVFFSVEDHASYRAPVDPEMLTAERWEWLQGEGFTIREAAQWWLNTLYNRCAGDLARCWREYPQKPEHAFKYAEGLWIGERPEVMEPIDELRHPGSANDITLYREPGQCSPNFAIGVDTSAGLGLDASALSLVDAADSFVVATWKDNKALIDNLVEGAEILQRAYTSEGNCPVAVIERNGIGHGTIQRAQSVGLYYEPMDMGAANRTLCMMGVKRLLDSASHAPADLVEEAKHVRTRGRNFYGDKDLMMATGMSMHGLGLTDGYYIENDEPEAPEPRGENYFSTRGRHG